MNVIFLWENFGPMHVDRCDAVADSGLDVLGLELYGKSDVYEWIPESGKKFNKITLFNSGRPRGLNLIYSLIRFRLKHGKSNWFMCHYEWKEIFIFACFLRLIGDRVFTMGCSKFDDWPRKSSKEFLKSFFFKPYKGAIGSGIRSRDYFCFHGIPTDKVVTEYNSVSIKRIREMSEIEDNYSNIDFTDRYFTIVARLVPKKNLHMALEAYKKYCELDSSPRVLHICGSGILEAELKNHAKQLGVENLVYFHGFVQTKQIAIILSRSIALILPSIEEQFGNVVIEAQALGLPVLLSDVCGARDNLIRSGVNGFVFEPDNYSGLAWFMDLLANNQILWQRMSDSAVEFSKKGDVSNFADAVKILIGEKK